MKVFPEVVAVQDIADPSQVIVLLFTIYFLYIQLGPTGPTRKFSNIVT